MAAMQVVGNGHAMPRHARVRDGDGSYLIELEVPTFTPDELAVELVGHTLSVSGEHAATAADAGQAFRLARNKQRARAIHGYAQRRFVVRTSYGSRATYESDLRPALEHVLAARLAERHAVNLYTEPDAAREKFCRTPADESLWPWIDPVYRLTA